MAAIALGLIKPILETGSSGYRPHLIVRRSNRGISRQAIIKTSLRLHKEDRDPRSRAVSNRLLRTLITRRGDVESLRTLKEVGPEWELMFHDKSPSFFAVGYGGMRRVEAATTTADFDTRAKTRLVRYERVASLFEDHFALRPLHTWLGELKLEKPSIHKQAVRIIRWLAPPNVKFTGKEENRDYLFRHGKVTIPFSGLSDGYREYIG